MAGTAAEQAYETIVPRLDPPMLIVTACWDDERSGCLVGFHAQSSIHPLRHTVMLSKANHTWKVAGEASHLVVHFCDERDVGLARLFGSQTGDEVDKFAQVEWHDSPAGVPVLGHCLTWLEGRILTRHDDGDHVAHLLEWTAGSTEGELRPLRLSAVGDLEPGHPA